MRPGQAAPDERGWSLVPSQVLRASMRPGQAAPDEQKRLADLWTAWTGFNEAGASSPG